MLRYLPFLILSAAPLHAEVPRVVTDIPPVHALVAQVMGDLGTPQLVVRPGSSPHHHTMRPSEARMLSEADAVVWVGPGLTRWLEEPIENLAGDAAVMTLMEVEGVELMGFREGATFAAHDHDHEGHEGHDDHEKHDDHSDHADHDDHDKHDDHADHDDHDKHEGHDDHAGHDTHEGHADHAAHDSAEMDPHVWLDPHNGALFLSKISALLGDLDPENATIYAANAKTGQAAISRAEKDIAAELAAVKGKSFIVLHDAYHYFEAHFDIEAAGSVSAGDAETPGGERMQTLRAVLVERDVDCAFSEPEIGTKLLDTATEGLTVNYGVLDPLGADQPLGADLYVNTLRAMASSMVACLAPKG